MKLYILTTFDDVAYTTAHWFFATSREKAEELVDETYSKVLTAVEKLERIDSLIKMLWREKYEIQIKYQITSRNISIFRLKQPSVYKQYQQEVSRVNTRVYNSYAFNRLVVLKQHYLKYNRPEVLLLAPKEWKELIQEVDSDTVQPIITVDGD